MFAAQLILVVMRKKEIIAFGVVLLILQYSAAFSGDIPKKIVREFVEKQIIHYCADLAFIECMGINKNTCTDSIVRANNGCDYKPVWLEFKQMDEGAIKKQMSGVENQKYANCVIANLINQTGVTPEQWSICTQMQHKQFVKELQNENRSN